MLEVKYTSSVLNDSYASKVECTLVGNFYFYALNDGTLQEIPRSRTDVNLCV